MDREAAHLSAIVPDCWALAIPPRSGRCPEAVKVHHWDNSIKRWQCVNSWGEALAIPDKDLLLIDLYAPPLGVEEFLSNQVAINAYRRGQK